MIKKLLTVLVIITSIFGSIVLAQTLGDIELQFCNPNQNNHELNLITQANTDTNICVSFQNRSQIDIPIEINFVDGVVTPQGYRSCMANDKAKPNFGQFLSTSTQEILLKANYTQQEIYSIKFPIGFSGISHGCLTYNIKNSDQQQALRTIFRKAHSIDILVEGIEVLSKIKLNKIKLSTDQTNNGNIILDVKNYGNNQQNISITGTISNRGGYKQSFEIQNFILDLQESKQVITAPIPLPTYKGIFQINLHITHKPNFNFHISNFNLSNQYDNAGNITFSTSLVIRNWWYTIGISIIIILLIVRIFKKKNKYIIKVKS